MRQLRVILSVGSAIWWIGLDAPIVSVTANALTDGSRYRQNNVVATLAQDGSIANIVYLANGDRSIPKEQFEVFCEGTVGRITDFSTLELARDGKVRRSSEAGQGTSA